MLTSLGESDFYEDEEVTEGSVHTKSVSTNNSPIPTREGVIR
jgi:hypothetical protein